jgi:hypothetical protein
MIDSSVTLSGSVTDALPSSGLTGTMTITVINASGTSSFPTPVVIASPLSANTGTFSYQVSLVDGLNTIIETTCDTAGNCTSFTKTITFYPAKLNVSVEEVDASAKPALQTDTALETKVFSVAAGSCAATIGNQVKNYGKIYSTCIAENTKLETLSPSGSNNKPRNFLTDLAGIGVGTGDKLVLVQSRANPNGSHAYMGFDLPNMQAGQSRDVGFERNPGQTAKGLFVQSSQFSRNTKLEWSGSNRAERIMGSVLEVYKPDLITWSDGEEIYPFTFISDSDWDLNVCLQVPAGYTIVAPGTCDQTLISNEAKVVEFQVASTSSTAAAAALAQAGGVEPNFTVNLTTKHKEAGSSVVKETSRSYQVSGLSSAGKKASDLALAPVIKKLQTEQLADQKAQAAKIAAVLAQAEQTAQGQAVSAIAITFKLTLTAGTQSEDVKRLQEYLNNHGFTVSVSGPGSKGQESTFFGPKTKAALIAFQEAHQAEILAHLGLVHGTGILGPSTRAYINAHQ